MTFVDIQTSTLKKRSMTLKHRIGLNFIIYCGKRIYTKFYLRGVEDYTFAIWKNTNRPRRKEIWVSIKWYICIWTVVDVSKKCCTAWSTIVDVCLVWHDKKSLQKFWVLNNKDKNLMKIIAEKQKILCHMEKECKRRRPNSNDHHTDMMEIERNMTT